MHRGWIKLWRAVLDDPDYRALPDAQARAWIGLLLQVEWQSAQYICPLCGAVLSLEAGETARSIRHLSDRSGVTRSTFDRLLNRFRKRQKVSWAKSGTRCHRKISVNNWHLYQSEESTRDKVGTRSGQGRDKVGTLEVKKERKKEVKKKGSKTASAVPVQVDLLMASAEVQETAEALRSVLHRANPDQEQLSPTQWPNTLAAWVPEIDKMRRLDGVSLAVQQQLFTWLAGDSKDAAFWRPQIHGARWFRGRTGGDPRKMVERLVAVFHRAQKGYLPIDDEEWEENDLKW